MNLAVSFNEVSVTGFFEDFSFEVEVGSSVLIETSGEEESTVLLRLITGISLPSRGRINVSGQSLMELTTSQLCHARQQIGVIPSRGGLISNLKLWENITLPLLYTSGHITQESEDQAISLLSKLGYTGNIMELPAHLSIYERRIAAFIRATLCQPQIMVYSNCFEDIPTEARKSFFTATAEFHSASVERTSLYFVSSVDTIRELIVDSTVKVHKSPEVTTGT